MFYLVGDLKSLFFNLVFLFTIVCKGRRKQFLRKHQQNGLNKNRNKKENCFQSRNLKIKISHLYHTLYYNIRITYNNSRFPFP